MNYGFKFSDDKLSANVVIGGNSPNAKILEDVLIDTGASISWFPREKLRTVGAMEGIYSKRPIETANGSIFMLPVYGVRVSLGLPDTEILSPPQEAYKKKVENDYIPVCAPKFDRALIGRDILTRYNKIHVDWYDRQIIDVDLG